MDIPVSEDDLRGVWHLVWQARDYRDVMERVRPPPSVAAIERQEHR